jgi:hypothetical protein
MVGGRTRTYEGVSQRIYSRLPLQLNQLLMCNMSHLCRVAALFIRRGGLLTASCRSAQIACAFSRSVLGSYGKSGGISIASQTASNSFKCSKFQYEAATSKASRNHATGLRKKRSVILSPILMTATPVQPPPSAPSSPRGNKWP